MVVFTNVKKEDLKKIPGFVAEEPKTPYEKLRLHKGDVILVLYTSGKLLVQGRTAAVVPVVAALKKHGLQEEIEQPPLRSEQGWIIGSDEALKGDTFGGIVVAAVKADEVLRRKLVQLGVKDSKQLRDKEVLLLAEKIKKIASCEIKALLPEEYNQHKNVTVLLNKLHKGCADYLRPGKHIVDKYPGCAVGDVAEEKAESKYVEVAAASILARAAALQQLDYLSGQAGFHLPKGSTHVKEALQKLKDFGLDFKQFVKIEFRNVKEFLVSGAQEPSRVEAH